MNTKNHIIHYIPLILVFVLGFIGMYLFQYDTEKQRGLIVAVALSYVVWGTVHHKIHNELTLEIFLEYLFVAIIGSAIVFAVV